MKRVKRMAALAAALVVTSAGVRAQESDVAAGHAFARNACQPCHAVEAEQRTPRRIVIGPAFRDVANTSGMTATAIRVFLRTSRLMARVLRVGADFASSTTKIKNRWRLVPGIPG